VGWIGGAVWAPLGLLGLGFGLDLGVELGEAGRTIFTILASIYGASAELIHYPEYRPTPV